MRRLDNPAENKAQGESFYCHAGSLWYDTIISLEFLVYPLKIEPLGHVRFEKMNLLPVKKTKSGYSTSAEVLWRRYCMG